MAGPPQWKEPVGFNRPERRQGLRQRTPLRPVGRRGRQRRTAWQKVVSTLKKRTSRCVACEVHVLAECNGRYEHTHHILPKGRGGPDTLANALPVSFAHHDWIHRNTRPAEALGLLAKTTHPSASPEEQS